MASKVLALFLLLILSFQPVHSQKWSALDSLRLRVEQLEKNQILGAANEKKVRDSLQRELHYFKVKDNFYSDAFTSQGTLYSGLMGTITTVLVAIGIGFILFRVNLVEQTINRSFRLFKNKANKKFLAIEEKMDKESNDWANAFTTLKDSVKVQYTAQLLNEALARHKASKDSFLNNRYGDSILTSLQSIRRLVSTYRIDESREMLSDEKFYQLFDESLETINASVSIGEKALEINYEVDIKLLISELPQYQTLINNEEFIEEVSSTIDIKRKQNFFDCRNRVLNLINQLFIWPPK